MSDDLLADEKRMRLRYAGTCRVCEVALPARVEAIYEKSTKTVRCLTHDDANATSDAEIPADPIDIGTPGASARREFERRKAGRERRVRARHPKIGGFLLAISDKPQSTTAWDKGAVGEERLGNRLNELASEQLRVLHDRRVPGSRANIDHLAVTPTGVYVIDAKKYAGRPRLKVEGGLLRPRTEKLLVGTRNCTKLVDGLLKQMDVVRGVISDGIPVHGVLCFVEADWPLFGGSFTSREVLVVWPRKLYPNLELAGPMTVKAIEQTHGALASALPPA